MKNAYRIRLYCTSGENDQPRGNAANLTQNQVVATSCWFESGQGHQPTLLRSFGWQARRSFSEGGPGAPISISPISRGSRCRRASPTSPRRADKQLSISRHSPGPRLLGASSYKWRTRRGSFARKPCDDFGRAWLGRRGQLIVLAKRETIFDGHVASIDVVALRQASLERCDKMRCVLA
jgi:hypothetical protein